MTTTAASTAHRHLSKLDDAILRVGREGAARFGALVSKVLQKVGDHATRKQVEARVYALEKSGALLTKPLLEVATKRRALAKPERWWVIGYDFPPGHAKRCVKHVSGPFASKFFADHAEKGQKHTWFTTVKRLDDLKTIADVQRWAEKHAHEKTKNPRLYLPSAQNFVRVRTVQLIRDGKSPEAAYAMAKNESRGSATKKKIARAVVGAVLKKKSKPKPKKSHATRATKRSPTKKGKKR